MFQEARVHHGLRTDDVVGFLHPAVDIHTLGIASASELLKACGVGTVLAGIEVCRAVGAGTDASEGLLARWVRENHLTALGFSYRLDPDDGRKMFGACVVTLRRFELLAEQGGPLRAVYFAGLPATCEAVTRDHPWVAAVFVGDETPGETLSLFGLDPALIPASLTGGLAYDEARWAFATELVRRGEYRNEPPPRWDYPGFGTATDRLVDRLAAGQRTGQLPLMRAHVGAYLPGRQEAVEQNLRWTLQLAAAGHLDVLSVGSSQLTQSDFFRDWGKKPNGGGVPLRTEEEFARLWRAARPMLVRAYSGTSDVVRVAQMLENQIHIAWHALSLWWFSQMDGRGPNSVQQNLREHWQTLLYIASTGKPFEPNLPHHFAFRGGDDLSYVVSGYLAARLAQKAGISDFVLQIMLNTPKATWGVQDLAKARTLLRLVRTLESPRFRVHLQPRGGLDYFSPNPEKAKIQLAAVTALMDDIEPDDPHSPAIIHVVSFSEATHLADPDVVNESVQITRHALREWRRRRVSGEGGLIGAVEDEVARRQKTLELEARQMIEAIEALIPDPYSPQGLYEVLAAGFFPVPYLWECRQEFSRAVQWKTKLVEGGVTVVRDDGTPLPLQERLGRIRAEYRGEDHG